MSNSVQTVVSDGSLTLLDISFNYFDRTHVHVYFDNVEQTLGTTWSWVGATDKKIQFSPAVADNVVVKVQRVTPLENPRHVYSSPGNAPFNKSTVDENFRQTLYAAQEAQEGANLGQLQQDLDAQGNKITDLGDALLDGDAVNLKVLREYLPYGPVAASLHSRITAEEAQTAALAGQYGSSLVGVATRAQLRAYSGDAARMQMTDSSVFVRTGTQADNGGSVVRDALSRSWQRLGMKEINLRDFGVVGDGTSGAVNLAACQVAFNAHGSGIYRFPYSPFGDNTFLLSDSWNLADHDNVVVWVDTGVTVKTSAPTTYGHTICIGAGPLIGGTSNGRVRNVGFTGGGSVIAESGTVVDNGIGFLRATDWFVIGMYLPEADRKAITVQVNDPTGDPAKFNGNGWVLNNKIGTTGHYAISIEGGCDGTVFIDGNTCESSGLDFIHLSGSVTPDVSIKRVVLGTNVCKASGGKGLYAFKVQDLQDGNTIVDTSTGRGLDASTCGNVSTGGFYKSTTSWGARISSCTGEIAIRDGFNAATTAGTFSALDLSNNASDANCGSAAIGSGTGTYALTATGKSLISFGARLKSGTSGLVSGVAIKGRLIADGIYCESTATSGVRAVPDGTVTLTVNSATPSVAGYMTGQVFKTANTSTTTITNFTGGYDGQIIEIVCNDTATTFADGPSIKMAGSTNWTAPAGNPTIRFVRAFNTWYECGRSIN